MIVYQDQFDLYHCIYRMMRIISGLSLAKPVEIERLRMYDFYILHPI